MIKEKEAFISAFLPSNIMLLDGKIFAKKDIVSRKDAENYGIFSSCELCHFEPPNCDKIQCSDMKYLWRWEEARDVQ